MNLARSSKFGINIDFNKSHDSYIYDNNTKKEYLDFFGMYASLPLGYNHPIFKTDEFIKEYMKTSSFKINNCEFKSNETQEFDLIFSQYSGKNIFKHFHYCCTGALAVEAAIKTCLDYKKYHPPRILSFHNSFHGINSYGGFVTSRFSGVDKRLHGLPENYSVKIEHNIEEILRVVQQQNITCILVEPIQCSAGDIHHQKEFFISLRKICDEYDIPLIFDEIQIGFGGTGKLWYYEHLGVEPDILIFGKKTQLSGIMVKPKFGSIFGKEKSIRLEVTWDGNVSDMIRCKYIIKAYKENSILKNAEKKGISLVEEISKIPDVLNARGSGLIVGFDLKNTQKRDIMVEKLYHNGLICNKTGDKTIRLRPNLNLTDNELDRAVEIFKKGIKC